MVIIMKNYRREIIEALSSISQLGLSVVISFLLWILIASWIRSTFSLGNGVMVAGVLFGMGSAVLSFVKFCKRTAVKEKKDE